MVIPTFIFTRVFAISAVYIGAFPGAYTAPIPTEDTITISFLERRVCRKMSCLYALPDADSSNEGNATTTASVPPASDTSSSVLQIIDLLISAMESAALSLHSSTTTEQTGIPAENSTVLATDGSANAQDNTPVVQVIDLST